MSCGLFGKLPAKRDFVSVGVPRAFLAVWEAWLDGGLADSRTALGTAWTEAFFAAPIWRFCLGRDICGVPTLGAMMPSVDAVGRSYPLTLVTSLPPGVATAALAADDDWFARVEECLLGALDPGLAFEATLARLDALGAPRPCSVPAPQRFHAAADPDMARPLAVLFKAAADVIDQASFWWTQGGAAHLPLAFSHHAMPTPDLFASLLTGRFPAETSMTGTAS